MKIINLSAFIISFALGCLLVYTLEPSKQQIWIYASPKNSDKIQFKNEANKCFDPVITNTSCTILAQDVNSEPSFMSNLTSSF
jgi:hypothetical protein